MINIKQYDKDNTNQTGIIRGEPNDCYHANAAISSSQLSQFLSDPQRFKALREGTIEREQKPCWTLGDLVHTLVLEPQEFNAKFVLDSSIPPKLTTTQKAALERFQTLEKPTSAQVKAHEKNSAIHQVHVEFWREHYGKLAVKDDELESANAMHAAIFADVDASKVLEGFDEMEKELTCRTPELENGFAVQVKLDTIDIKAKRVIDLKTCRSLDAFAKNFSDFGYYRQAAFYSLVAQLMGIEIDSFLFVVVETEAPYEVAVFEADEDAIHRGIAEIKAGLNALGKCIKSNDYPKRYSGINVLSLKPWDERRSDERIERLADMEGCES